MKVLPKKLYTTLKAEKATLDHKTLSSESFGDSFSVQASIFYISCNKNVGYFHLS
ncbi:MAG: hypothetical protein BAJALOKI1v1_1000007 [Promethearchaeota archaeon]|nr:MAG: hypothetical protein BAJALOKI1v1_1000007 [Candidatus Lokiarchaeota archaeon]